MNKHLYFFAFLFTFFAAKSYAQCIYTVAGYGYLANSGYGGFSGDGGPANSAQLYYTTGVAFDNSGNMFIADQQNAIIRKVSKATGIITTIAGSPMNAGYNGDGSQATDAQLNWPSALAFDKAGNLYIADQANSVIREVNMTTGIITTAVGNNVNGGAYGYGGDGLPATSDSVFLQLPTGIAFDKSGNMFIADAGNNVVREVNTSGTITTFMGTGTAGYTKNATGLSLLNLQSAPLNQPSSIAIDNKGDIFIADKGNNVIQKVTNTLGLLWNIATVAGRDSTVGDYRGDGGPATDAKLNTPIGVTLDAAGNIYIADENNNRIREVIGGKIYTIAGTITQGYSGDGGPATVAELSAPWAVTLGPGGNIYIPDNFNNSIRVIKHCTAGVYAYPDSSYICSGDSAPLAAYGDSAFTWAPSTGLNTTTGANVIASPTVTTTYTVTGKPSGGKSFAVVSVFPVPTFSITSGITTTPGICAGGKDTLIANISSSSGSTYSWNPSISNVISTSSTKFVGVVSPTVTTTYSLTVTNANGCSNTGSFTVNVSTIKVNPSNPIICPLGTATLTASGGLSASYAWSPSTGLSATSGTTVFAKPASTTVYSVTGTTSLGCKTTINDTVIVATPNVTATASPQIICKGSGSKLTASGASTYTWAPSISLSSSTGASVTAVPSVTTTYTVTGVTSSGCSATAIVIVNVGSTATITVNSSASTGLCSGQNATLTASPSSGFTYTWSPSTGLNNTTGNSVNATPSVTTEYTVTATNTSASCSVVDSIPVVVNTPTVTVTASTLKLCSGDFDTLKASGATIYTWSPSTYLSSTTGSTVISDPWTSASYPYTYTVTGTYAGCTASATITFTVSATPSVTVTAAPSTICLGKSSTLTATGANFSYFWSTGSTSSSTIVNPSGTTTYTVTGTNTYGCKGTAKTTVTVNDSVTVTTTPTNITCNGMCNGKATASILLGSGSPYTYSWAPTGETTDPATNLCPGNYTVFVRSKTGCIGFATANITEPPQLTAHVSSFTDVACNGGTSGSATVLAAGGTSPYTFSWTPSGGSGSTASGLAAGNYTCTVTDKNGCTATATISINQPALLNYTSGPSNITCYGNKGAAGVNVSGGGTPPYTYFWASGRTSDTLDNIVPGTYTCTITDANSCITTVTVTVIGPTSPLSVSIGSSINVQCNGTNKGAANVNVTGGTTPYSYNWTPAGGGGSTATNLFAGAYTCTVTDNNGCSGTATVNITQPPAVTVNNDNTIICPLGTATLTATGGGGVSPYTYSWSTGQTNTSIIVSPPTSTTYTVTVTDKNGCAGQMPDIVSIDPPLTEIGVSASSLTVCAGQSVNLSDNISGGFGTINYAWSNGGTGSSITVNPSSSTTYSVTATDACGTSSGAVGNVSINVISFPSFSVCCDSTITAGQSVNLLVTPSSGYTYSWTPSAGLNCNTCPNPIATPSVNTTYTVTISNGPCSTMDTVAIDIGTGKLFFYNGITPNGDGHNDTWVIDNIELYSNNSVTIFNRWGIEVWKADNYNNTTVVWQGLNNSGQPLPDATYFYIVKVNGATYKGWVQLTR